MLVSQKCQYALRAIFELSRNHGNRPCRIGDIAQAQAIPQRFLEVILSQLKQAGFVVSHRGAEGGYLLARRPSEIQVGEVIEFIQGPLAPAQCVPQPPQPGHGNCALHGDCVFVELWAQVQQAIAGIYESTTFQDLLDREKSKAGFTPSYSI